MWFLFLMIFMATVQAQEVFYDKNTGEILFIEESSSVFLSSEDKARVATAPVPDKFKKEELNRSVSYYKYVDGKIVLNAKKVADEEDRFIQESKKAEKMSKNKASVADKLKAQGLTDDEIKVLIN